METLREDPRIRAVEWHDLRKLTTRQKVVEVTGLRVAHGAQHYSIGIGRRGHDVLLLVLSVLMVASLHALQATHMHHHRHCMDDSDMEASTARTPWWKALLSGPWFIAALHRRGYALAKPKKRRWIRLEGAIAATWVAAGAAFGPLGLRWFLGAMVLGECLTGFFAVWTVHHDCDPHQEIDRTQRGRWKTWISYEMFYHVEHHLFPGGPDAAPPGARGPSRRRRAEPGRETGLLTGSGGSAPDG